MSGPRAAGVAGSTEELGRLGRLLRACAVVAAVALAASLVPWGGRVAAARAGVAVLLSAPYVATLSAAVHYARRRRRVEAALAALLLGLLLAGLWLGTGRG